MPSKLQPLDKVEILAPASRCTDADLLAMKELLTSWQLECIVQETIFGEDLLCANSDEMRFQHLKNALINPEIKAIFCARGGYGSLRLIPKLQELPKPLSPKILVGFSDITALHLYMQQQWGWTGIHGSAAPNRFSSESIQSLKTLLFDSNKSLELNQLTALNSYALENICIESSLIGGNLALIQTGIGTSWQLECQNKILVLEDIGERAYKIDRMLEQLIQAQIIQKASAILLGDFLEAEEPNGTSLVNEVLQRFADSIKIPVLRIKGIGHGFDNMPLPLGSAVSLRLGKEAKLII